MSGKFSGVTRRPKMSPPKFPEGFAWPEVLGDNFAECQSPLVDCACNMLCFDLLFRCYNNVLSKEITSPLPFCQFRPPGFSRSSIQFFEQHHQYPDPGVGKTSMPQTRFDGGAPCGRRPMCTTWDPRPRRALMARLCPSVPPSSFRMGQCLRWGRAPVATPKRDFAILQRMMCHSFGVQRANNRGE